MRAPNGALGRLESASSSEEGRVALGGPESEPRHDFCPLHMARHPAISRPNEKPDALGEVFRRVEGSISWRSSWGESRRDKFNQ